MSQNGMYAPAFLSLNKKPAKSCNIHKPKRLGSTKRNIFGLANRLNPEALKLRMVPNINMALLLVQKKTKTDHFDIQTLAKTFNFAMYFQNHEVSMIPTVQKEAV